MATIIHLDKVRKKRLAQQHIEERLQLSENLPLFNPNQRFAILLNTNYEREEYGRKYSQGDISYASNQHIFGLEMLLTGRLHPFPGKRLQEKAESVISLMLSPQRELHAERTIAYQSVKRILPTFEFRTRATNRKTTNLFHFPQQDPFSELERAIKKIAGEATHQDLTFVYVTPSSESGQLFIGHSILYSSQFFDMLDTIEGKKVVVLQTDYSGYFAKVLSRRPTQKHYILLASCDAHTMSSFHVENELHSLLLTHLAKQQPLSSLNIHQCCRFQQKPQISGNFDVIL